MPRRRSSCRPARRRCARPRRRSSPRAGVQAASSATSGRSGRAVGPPRPGSAPQWVTIAALAPGVSSGHSASAWADHARGPGAIGPPGPPRRGTGAESEPPERPRRDAAPRRRTERGTVAPDRRARSSTTTTQSATRPPSAGRAPQRQMQLGGVAEPRPRRRRRDLRRERPTNSASSGSGTATTATAAVSVWPPRQCTRTPSDRPGPPRSPVSAADPFREAPRQLAGNRLVAARDADGRVVAMVLGPEHPSGARLRQRDGQRRLDPPEGADRPGRLGDRHSEAATSSSAPARARAPPPSPPVPARPSAPRARRSAGGRTRARGDQLEPELRGQPPQHRLIGAMNSPPRSTIVPSAKVCDQVRPPTRSRASSTVTSTPARCSRQAACRPARPAPITTTPLGRAASPPLSVGIMPAHHASLAACTAALALALAGALVLAIAGPAYADRVIGHGTPAGCTSARVVAAVRHGGLIRFACGPDPVTIPMRATAKVVNTSRRVVIDGGGLVTLERPRAGAGSSTWTRATSTRRGPRRTARTRPRPD